MLYETLRRAGHAVKVVATQASLYFFVPAQILRESLILDQDEWPGRSEGRRWQRDEEVRHIQLRCWGDLLLIASLDANTLAKLAKGLADNCLTSVWRAWKLARPVMLALALNTLMWQHSVTARHLRLIAADMGALPPEGLALESLLGRINNHGPHFHSLAPDSRRLTCGDVGVGAMSAVETIAERVQTMLNIGNS